MELHGENRCPSYPPSPLTGVYGDKMNDEMCNGQIRCEESSIDDFFDHPITEKLIK